MGYMHAGMERGHQVNQPCSCAHPLAHKQVEKQCGRVFGDTNGTPLLLSVRSGAVVSMPGMMDTGTYVYAHTWTLTSD